MLDMCQCYTPKPTNTYGGEEHYASDLSGLVSRPKLIQQYCRSAKGAGMQKAVGGHFEFAVWIDVTSINMSCFFTPPLSSTWPHLNSDFGLEEGEY